MGTKTKNLTKSKLMGFLLASAVVFSPMMVYADNGGGNDWHQGGGWHHGKEGHMMAKILGLTDDQVKQLKDLHEKQKVAIKALFEQMKTNREAFGAEIVKATPDMNKINDIQTQIKALQSQMVDSHLSSLLDIKKIMTPEQFAGFMVLNKEHRMMKHMMGHGKFDHKGGLAKDGDGHHWGDKGDGDHDAE